MVTPDEIYTMWDKADSEIERVKNTVSWLMERKTWEREEWDSLNIAMEYLEEAQKELAQINVS